VVRASRLHTLGIVRICRRGRLPFDRLTALSNVEGHHKLPPLTEACPAEIVVACADVDGLRRGYYHLLAKKGYVYVAIGISSILYLLRSF